MAREMGFDLVEVADKASPPVCRIMDYGKYKYENAQRQKESRKKSSNTVVKEMKYRPKIGTGDFDQKTAKVEKFLLQGHKVKLTIMFRGREVQHPEFGKRILDQVADEVVHAGRVESYPKLDGRNMTMVLGPDRQAQAAWRKKLAEAEAEGEQAQAMVDANAAAAAASETAGTETVESETVESETVESEAATAEPEAAEPKAAQKDAAETAVSDTEEPDPSGEDETENPETDQ